MTVRRKELDIEPALVPQLWEDVVAACLAKDPSRRPQSAAEVAQQLQIAPAQTRTRRAPGKSLNRKSLLAGGIAAFSVLALASLYFGTLKRQAKPVFTQGGTTQTITLSGTAGVLVTVHSASQSATYSGPTDFSQAGFPILKEARLTQDFEGTVSWGLGLGSPACMRVFTLVGPARLVIDFATTSS